jgi:hypothetical protein
MDLGHTFGNAYSSLPKPESLLLVAFYSKLETLKNEILLLSLLQNYCFCHPERSEGSISIKKTRFFSTLRMTIRGNGDICKSLF